MSLALSRVEAFTTLDVPIGVDPGNMPQALTVAWRVESRTPELANIGPRGRRRRLVFGIVGTCGALAVVALNLAARSHLWLLVVFVLFFSGALGALQAGVHT